ncbi:hypothetical protein FGG90_03835 [Clavibacter tessellarius]|uniref:Secreted protein n=1 Tax=Clavibacter tessellarius TaxID=31965 RepID=A0A225CQ21_9MICO|nr:hypothetical protein [Clavibacter michiganensis]OQJ63822.1 hypothetical protein B5P24_12880 [Clavibacter michiganensis subsp. tessellarius]UKF33199.1 hypothetical protein FGG90_03835 [Clavibacter michiganensis subsp. tessellarius]
MNRSIPALALAAALLLGAALPAASAAPASAAPAGTVVYYSNPFDDTLIAVRPGDTSLDPSGATFDEWRTDGFPTPVPATVTYIGYSWESTIWADQTFGRFSSTTMLDFDRWTHAGRPAARDDRLAHQHEIIRYDGSDELFVLEGASFTDEPGFHKLTFREYAHLGQPPVDRVEATTFRKLAWLPAVVGPKDFTGEVGVIDFAAWDYYARPTPQIVKSFDGDRFCKTAGSADIRYVGIAAPKGVKLSYAQWREAGFPAPGRC